MPEIRQLYRNLYVYAQVDVSKSSPSNIYRLNIWIETEADTNKTGQCGIVSHSTLSLIEDEEFKVFIDDSYYLICLGWTNFTVDDIISDGAIYQE